MKYLTTVNEAVDVIRLPDQRSRRKPGGDGGGISMVRAISVHVLKLSGLCLFRFIISGRQRAFMPDTIAEFPLVFDFHAWFVRWWACFRFNTGARKLLSLLIRRNEGVKRHCVGVLCRYSLGSRARRHFADGRFPFRGSVLFEYVAYLSSSRPIGRVCHYYASTGSK